MPEPKSSLNPKPWGLAVRGVTQDQAGRWLLVRRSSRCNHYPGTWEPPGGKLDPDETLDSALCREIREETGLSVRPTGIAGVAHFESPHLQMVTIYFHTTSEHNEVVLSGEHDDFAWTPATEIETLNLDSQMRAFLKTFLLTATMS